MGTGLDSKAVQQFCSFGAFQNALWASSSFHPSSSLERGSSGGAKYFTPRVQYFRGRKPLLHGE